uniref:Uncharacterized protein n=1 Tax=Arundo donax TaxID=35708 RepID=A0A0A9DES3_ARUDO
MNYDLYFTKKLVHSLVMVLPAYLATLLFLNGVWKLFITFFFCSCA